MSGCLSRSRVLDLSRIFAGPWAAQMLADFGADVIKVERPQRGDDVRQQGHRMKDRQGRETSETSSFLAMNRGKRSVTIDLASPVGQDLIRRLAQESDILIENFKAGDLRRYGLDYETLSRANPRLVYCSITGFGQSGPYSHLPGYDPIFQSMSGLMSVTGNPDDEPGGGPQKVGYSIADITAGLYASIAILAALNYRDTVSGRGQYIDLALLDAQVAAMSHVAMNYLVSGRLQERMGTASPITCPWQTFKCAEGDITIAVGNDPQFVRFCEVLGKPALAGDPRFSTNPMRAKNRRTLVPMLEEALLKRSARKWYEAFEAAGVPSGPTYDFRQVFEDPQIRHRELLTEMAHPLAGAVPMVANPIKFSDTPIEYRRPPPLLGEHTREVLREVLRLDEPAIDALAQQGAI
ncbi:MAG TPA: CoA transferase [Burkholderiales bacterium]|nr:CoA transferase [Burkholderiales bacterium]